MKWVLWCVISYYLSHHDWNYMWLVCTSLFFTGEYWASEMLNNRSMVTESIICCQNCKMIKSVVSK